jgi:hypothetical protein
VARFRWNYPNQSSAEVFIIPGSLYS